MACRPTLTVQSQICETLTVSSIISLYLAGKQRRSNPLATLAIARGGTFQGAAKSSHLL